MSSTTVLALPNFNEQFCLETDACDTGIGAVLMQLGKPIAYLSKPLAPTHQHLSIYEKEFLALIMAVERWRPYLQRIEFTINTDHKSLCYLEEQHLQSDLQRKAMTRLMGLQFKIVYRQGRENKAADALSRVAHLMATHLISEAKPLRIQEVLNSYVTDQEAQTLIIQLAVKSPNEHGYDLHQGLVRKDQTLWVGNNSAVRTKIIAALHATAVGGHSGILATYNRLKKLFYWKGLKQDVDNFVKQCEVCQQAKHELIPPPGLLQSLPVPQGAWQDITMDFIEGLPKSERYDTILVVVDRFSKYAHFIPLTHPFNAQVVAQAVFDNVVKLHGIPKTIVSDRDKIFTAHFWTELFKLMGTKLTMSTAYHPQTDRQSERVNQCLEMYLRCAVHQSPKKWKQWLAQAELWYNSSHHSSLGCSPFKALYGHEPNMLSIPSDPTTSNTSVADRGHPCVFVIL